MVVVGVGGIGGVVLFNFIVGGFIFYFFIRFRVILGMGYCGFRSFCRVY